MKKIAIIADGWKKYVNYAWVKGCQDYIKEKELDVNLYVFHSFGNYSKDEKYNSGEYNIYNLPDLKEFDGIIMELTNVSDKDAKQRIISRVRQSNIPAVSIIEHIPGIYYVGIDNYMAMERLVEHLITVHGAKTLNYIGGPENNDENQIRLLAYKDVLLRHGIPYDEKRVIHNSFEITTGELGFEHFMKEKMIPDAFVCANDNIAVGVCHTAKNYGYSVPDDFMVTGFDNFDKAAYYSPRITTAGFTRESIAYQAVAAIDKLWKGQSLEKSAHYAEVEWEFQESCGCKAKNPRSRGQYVVDRIFAEEFEDKLQNELLELKRDLMEADTFEDMAKGISECYAMLNCSATYMIMNEGIEDGEDLSKFDVLDEPVLLGLGYPKNMQVVVACDETGRYNNCQLKKGELFPDETHERGGNLYFFSPLHFREQEVGYMVLKNCHFLMDNQQIFEILSVFQEALEHMYHRIVLKRMNEELERLYIMDSLTGLYNRMAYSHLAEPLFEKCKQKKSPLAILFVDMDRLKYINDNFGHDAGNVAIKSLSMAIAHATPMDSVNIRYGGDEFLLLVPKVNEEQVEEIIDKMRRMMDNTANVMNTTFKISASVGYVVIKEFDKSFNEYINMADDKMYENKEKRKLYVE